MPGTNSNTGVSVCVGTGVIVLLAVGVGVNGTLDVGRSKAVFDAEGDGEGDATVELGSSEGEAVGGDSWQPDINPARMHTRNTPLEQ